METLRCVLLDDELPSLTYLRMLCERLAGVVVVNVYNDPLKFLKEFSSIEFDVCILDIEMPGSNGLEVAQHLYGKAIIFSTAYKEYAAEAFDQEAVDYIRKPYQSERLEKALTKARNFLKHTRQREGAFIELNSNKGKILLHFIDIVFVTTTDSDRRDKKVVLRDNQQLVLKNISFDKLLALLPEDRFCRINRQTILSLDCVFSYSHDLITCRFAIADGKPVQFILSEQFREDFKVKIKSE